MIIIFDFNRTLYNPQTAQLYDDWVVLKLLKNSGCALWLWSTNEKNRVEKIQRSNLTPYFDKVILVDKKTAKDLSLAKNAWVVSDYFEDIEIANNCGLKTIWLRRGKYKNRYPECKPTVTINNLCKVLPQLETNKKNQREVTSNG